MFKVTHEIFSETNIIKILAFLIATYLLCYVGVFCNRQSSFLWVPNVPFSPTYSLIRVKQTWCRASEQNRRKASPILYFTFQYIDDVLLLNDYMLGGFVNHIYHNALETKNTTDTARSVSCLDLHMELEFVCQCVVCSSSTCEFWLPLWYLQTILTVAIVTKLTITEYLCHRWPRICSVCHSQNHVLPGSFMTHLYHWIFIKS